MDLPDSYIEISHFYTWMGEDGICRTKVKQGAKVTIVEALENSKAVLSLAGDSKFPLVVDSRGIHSITKQARDHFSMNNRPSKVNAIALIIGSPVSVVIGNFFMGLSKSRVPVKLFTSPEEAINWANFFVGEE